MSGWIRVERKIFGPESMFSDAPMSEREAWIWMISKAAWTDTKHRVGSDFLPVPRGSFMVTLRELQASFGWGSTTKVRAFLRLLTSENAIKHTTVGAKNTPKTHVTICNYDKYQTDAQTENTPKTHQATPKNTVKKQINNKQGSSNEELALAFDAFKAMSDRSGWPKPKSLSADRKKALSARLKELGGLDGWHDALSRASASDFLAQSSWFGFDWMVKTANLRKIMEGNYDNRNRPTGQTSNAGRHSPHDALMAGFAAFANSDDGAGSDDFGAMHGGDGTGPEEMADRSGCGASEPFLRVIGQS